jgi:hypothetical protein
MRRDSDMAEQIVLQLLRQGVVALPIHDSYIVSNTSKSKGELMEAMAAALHKCTSTNRYRRTGSTKNIPQYGGGGGGGHLSCSDASLSVHWVFVFFPDLPQPDFFGAHRLAIPASDLLVWRSGLLPQGVRLALHHESRRRDLRQIDIALLVGLSRSQVANLLSRRSGASSESAARILEFLIAGAKTVGGPP